MKHLILGLDGLGSESLQALQMPGLEHLLKSGETANPSVDNVVSRGWPELYSGQTAEVTGAYYQIPVMSNGRITPTQRTGSSVVRNHLGEEALLWSRLKAEGHSVGVFGLPTVSEVLPTAEFTFPASGAGVFSSSMKDSPIFPPTASRFANYSLNTLGFRIGRGAYLPSNSDDLDMWLRDHLAQFFATLRLFLARHPTDSLIVGSRFFTLFYKFRHVFQDDATDADRKLAGILKSVAKDFDALLTDFVEQLDAEHVFVVSDHGTGALRYHVNINELLRRVKLIDFRPLWYRLARWGYLSTIGKVTRGRHSSGVFPTFNLDKSKAFSIGYTDCIYINDSRFTGPRMSSEQRYALAADIAEELSAYCKEHRLEQFVSFTPLMNEGMTTGPEDDAHRIPLPDIRVMLEEGAVNLERTNRTIVKSNVPYDSTEMFKRGFEAQHSGAKTADTLAAYIGPNPELVEMESLTGIYESIVRIARL